MAMRDAMRTCLTCDADGDRTGHGTQKQAMGGVHEQERSEMLHCNFF
jgi:hypothetical protein